MSIYLQMNNQQIYLISKEREKDTIGTHFSLILEKEKNIKGNGKLINISLHGKDQELLYFLMDLNTWVWYLKDSSMEKVEFKTQMETYIMENGKKEKLTEKVF